MTQIPPPLKPPAAGGDVSRILRDWSPERPFTVEAALREHPDVADDRSALVDLAYEEFCRLAESGSPVSPSRFVGRFPGIERSLRRVLDLHSFCWSDPELRRRLFSIQWPAPGEEILGFRLEREIGRGAESRVYLASDPALANRQVVIKIGSLPDEAATLGRLDHPHIVPVFFARSDPKTKLAVLCMPWLGPATLLSVIDRLPRSAPRTGSDLARAISESSVGAVKRHAAARSPRRFSIAVARLAAPLAHALTYAHSQGVIHSDVKPSNILITADGKPLLLDFNLARSSDTRLVGGTIPYMAPEQLATLPGVPLPSGFQPGDIVPATDVFSIGVTLYELVSGRMPFGPLDETDVLAAAAALAAGQRRGPLPLRHSFRFTDRRLARLIAACLAFDPSERPTAASLAAELEEISTSGRRNLARAGAALAACTLTAATLWGAARPPDLPPDAIPAQATGDAEALALQGWRHLAEGQDQLALAELARSHRLRADPRTSAALGYCVLRSAGEWSTAARYFEEAIDGGLDASEVRNAAGYCHLQSGASSQAEAHLTRALDLDSTFLAARRNLILLSLRDAARRDFVPDFKHVKAAFAEAGSSPLLNLDAACVFAQACAAGSDHERELLLHCEAAVEGGVEPGRLHSVAAYHPPLAELPRFRRLVGQAAPAGSADSLAERVPPPFPLRAGLSRLAPDAQ